MEIKEESKETSQLEISYTNETIENLSDGLVNLFKPQLQRTQGQLGELQEKQKVLLEQLHDENLKVSWTQNSVDLHKMFDTITLCHLKLINIKKEMRSLHDRSTRLRKRALRIQQHKEKTEYVLNVQKEMDLKREQDLIGKSSQQT